MPFRVLIFGSRDIESEPPSPVWTVLDGLAFPAIPEAPMEVIDGGGPTGADLAAREWRKRSPSADPEVISGLSFPADWYAPCDPAFCRPDHRRTRGGRSWCPAAGPRRNQGMAELLAGSKLCQAWGFVNKPIRQSRGSRDMRDRLLAVGIEPIMVHVPRSR
jgi:hypothetical protein